MRALLYSQFHFLIIFFSLLGLQASYASESRTKLQVVSTFSVLNSIVREIAVEHVTFTSLIPENREPHNYSLTPHDLEILSKANLIVANGIGLDTQIVGYIHSLQHDARPEVVIMSQGMDAYSVRKKKLVPNNQCNQSLECDPHLWMSLNNVQRYAKTFVDTLSKLDPTFSTKLHQRYETFVSKVEALKNEYSTKFEHLRHTLIVTDHPGLMYTGMDFGLTIMSLNLGDSHDTLPQTVSAILQKIKTYKHVIFFSSEPENVTTIKQLSIDTHQTYGGHLYIDQLDPSYKGQDQYLHMMRSNLETLSRNHAKP